MNTEGVPPSGKPRSERLERLRATALSVDVCGKARAVGVTSDSTIIAQCDRTESGDDPISAVADMSMPLIELPSPPPASCPPEATSDDGPVPAHRVDARHDGPPPPLALPAFTLADAPQGDAAGPYPVGECCRELRASLLGHFPEKQRGAVLWLAPDHGAVPASRLVDFALALAEESPEGVLLLDTDFHQAQLTRHFSLLDKPGLSEVLAKKLHWGVASRRTAMARISVLPAGALCESATAAAADREAWEHLFEEMKKRHRFILASAEAAGAESPDGPLAALAAAADAIYVVVAVDHTPRHTVHQTLASLRSYGANVTGCVVTSVPKAA